MAKPLTELLKQTLKLPFEYRNPDINECGCGCGPINRNEHAYIESKVTGKWYCDIVGMVQAEGAEWEGERIRDEWGTLYSLDNYKKVMEVVSHG